MSLDHRLKNLLIIDIETVANEPDYNKLNDTLKKFWDRKSTFFRNEEALTSEELYAKKAGIFSEFGKIVVIACGIFHELDDGAVGLRVKSFANADEVSLLQDFKHMLETRFDPEGVRLCGHNGKEFDFPYLSRRMLINGLSLPYVLDNAGKKPWEVNFLDTLEMWKFGDRKNYTALDLLTAIFDIPSSKSNIDGSMVNDIFYQEDDGLKKIETYCQGDVIATAQLYLKLHTMDIIPNEHITIVE